MQFTFVLDSDWCLPTHIQSFFNLQKRTYSLLRQNCEFGNSPKETTQRLRKCHFARRNEVTSSPAAEGRYTGRSPVHQLRRRAPRRWHSAKRRVRVDHDVHRLESPGRPRVSRESSGYRWTTGSRTYATAYPSLTSARERIARNSTSSSS